MWNDSNWFTACFRSLSFCKPSSSCYTGTVLPDDTYISQPIPHNSINGQQTHTLTHTLTYTLTSRENKASAHIGRTLGYKQGDDMSTFKIYYIQAEVPGVAQGSHSYFRRLP